MPTAYSPPLRAAKMTCQKDEVRTSLSGLLLGWSLPSHINDDSILPAAQAKCIGFILTPFLLGHATSRLKKLINLAFETHDQSNHCGPDQNSARSLLPVILTAAALSASPLGSVLPFLGRLPNKAF